MAGTEARRYESNREYLDKLGKDLVKAQREVGLHPPFDDTDAADYLLPRMLHGLSPSARKKLTSREPRPRRKRYPRRVDCVDTILGLGFIQKRKLAPAVRKALGYDAPIPLERLGDELARIERGVDKKLAQQFWYPHQDYLGSAFLPETEGLHIWEIREASLPNLPVQWLWGHSTFRDHVDFVSETLNCHPALALAFLLCDAPVHRDSVTVVLSPYALLSPNQGLSLYVGRPKVAVWLVAWTYGLARKIALIMGNRGQPIATSPRPRAETRRVATLVDLVNETKKVKWADRLRKWNAQHPEWKYNNVNSMRTVYYRAMAKARRPAAKLKGRKAAA